MVYFEIAPVRGYSKWGFLAKKVFYHRNIWNNLVSNIFAVEIHGFISQKYLKIINGPRPWVLLRAVDVDVAVGGGGEGGAQLLCRRQLGRAQHAVRRQRGGVQHRVVWVWVQQGGIWVHLLCLFLRRDLTTWFKWRRLLQRLGWVELGWKWCQRWLFCWLWCLWRLWWWLNVNFDGNSIQYHWYYQALISHQLWSFNQLWNWDPIESEWIPDDSRRCKSHNEFVQFGKI